MSDRDQDQGQSESLEQAMKKLLEQSTSITNTSGGTAHATTLKAEDKEFLEHALESTVSKQDTGLVAVMKLLEKLCLELPREPTTDELEALEDLQEATEEFNCADAYIGMGGIKLCDRLLDVTNPKVHEASLSIIANVALNNDKFQNHPDANPLLKKVLIVGKAAVDQRSKEKTLSAVSSILSSNAPAIAFALAEPSIGLAYFFNLYETHPSSYPFRTERVIQHIFKEFPETPEVDPAAPTICFCRNLLQSWWKGHADPEWRNWSIAKLKMLHSILISNNPVIRKKLMEELGPAMKELLEKMRVATLEKKDGQEDEDTETLLNFQRALDENFGVDAVAATGKPLSICP